MGWRSRVAVSCGAGHRPDSDAALLWLWCWPPATALIQPLAWEPPCAGGCGPKKTERQKKKKKVDESFYLSKRSITIVRNIRFFFFFFFLLFRATPAAYSGSQARGLIGAVVAGLRQSHSNTRSVPHL